MTADHAATIRECPDKACSATSPEGCKYPMWRMCGHPTDRPKRTAELEQADRVALTDAECARLMAPTDDVWGVDDLEPLGVQVVGYDPLTAELLYGSRLDELGALR